MRRLWTMPLILMICLLVSFTGFAAEKEITFWCSYSQPERIKAIEDTITRFEAENPGIQVKRELVPWSNMHQKWIAAKMANTLPQLATETDSEAIGMYEGGVLEPVDGLVKKMGGAGRFLPGPLQGFRYRGKQIGIPHYTLSWMMVYRKDWLAKAGFTQPPKTWKEFEKAAIAETNPAEQRYGFTIPLGKSAEKSKEWLAYFMRTNGAEYFDAKGRVKFNSKATAETVSFMVNLYKKASNPAAINYTEDDVYNQYAQGRSGFVFASGSICNKILQVAPQLIQVTDIIPTPYNRRPGAVGAGPICLVKFAHNKYSAETDKFVQFMLRDDNYIPFLHSQLSMIPITKSAATSEKFYDFPDIKLIRPLLEKWIDGANKGKKFGMDYGLNPYNAYGLNGSIIEDMFQSIILDNVSVGTAVKKVHDKIQEQLDAAGY